MVSRPVAVLALVVVALSVAHLVRESTKEPEPATVRSTPGPHPPIGETHSDPSQSGGSAPSNNVGSPATDQRPSVPQEAVEGCTISGRVMDTADRPLEGVWVQLASREGVITQPALSGSEGRFALSGIAPGRYQFGVTCWRGSDISLRVAKDPPPFDVRAGEHLEDIIVRVREWESYTIEGNVRDETSNAPLEGVRVKVVGVRRLAESTTDSKGDFQLPKTSKSEVDLKFSRAGYQERLLTKIQWDAENLRVRLSKFGGVSGRVCDSNTGDPLEGFHVRVARLTKPDGTEGSAGVPNSDLGDGHFQVTQVESGVATLWVARFGYLSRKISDVTVALGQETSLGVIHLEAFGAMEGYIKFHGTPREDAGRGSSFFGGALARKNSVNLTPLDEDPNGERTNILVLDPVKVAYKKTDRFLMWSNTYTDGYYRIEDIPPGRYLVTATAMFFETSRYESINRTKVSVGPGETIWLNLEMSGSSGLRGRSSIQEGHIRPEIRVYSQGTAQISLKDSREADYDERLVGVTILDPESGQYEILNLLPGNYDVAYTCKKQRPESEDEVWVEGGGEDYESGEWRSGKTTYTPTFERIMRFERVTLKDGEVAELDFAW